MVGPSLRLALRVSDDSHVIGAANNLCAAMLDNHIKLGNALGMP